MPVLVAVAALALALGVARLIVHGSGVPAPVALVTIDGAASAARIPDGFLGLSLEYTAIEPYAGADPSALDPLFVALVRNLAPGQRPVLRIGGDSADWSWWPVPGLARPPGVTNTLDDRWLAVTRALTRTLRARLILGLNLEAGDPQIAAAEARALLGSLDPASILALELGNEPELYGAFPWYHTRSGRGVPGRPASYDFARFLADFTRFAAALPDVPLAGPTTGGPGWVPNLGAFLSAAPKVSILTLHRYPLQRCFTGRRSPSYPSIANLLAPGASAGLAAIFAPQAALAHARGRTLRVDELNSVSCGADRAVSGTFAAALWALDTLFQMVRAGVDGVNVHTFPGAGYELFRFTDAGGRWRAWVSPEYYGLLLFAAAAPAGSRLVPLSVRDPGPVSAWATLAPDQRLRVVLINKAVRHAQRVAIAAGARRGPATLVRLQAPGAAASAGVTLGGQSFGASTSTGRLAGARRAETVAADGGRYGVTVAPASAVLLTLPRGA